MSRMFKSIDRTWNVFVGCRFDCIYCCAKRLAEGRLKYSPRYEWGFAPQLVESELKRTFKPGQFIFVSFMGDISFAAIPAIVAIRGRISKFPETNFLLQTKNPRCFSTWEIPMPANVYLGTTIETDIDFKLTKAPPPKERIRDFISLLHPRKFLSIEPIMDFNLEVIIAWVNILEPDIVEVGADNYNNHLPEPSPEKVEQLLMRLKNICPKVIEKEGLKRLRQEMPV